MEGLTYEYIVTDRPSSDQKSIRIILKKNEVEIGHFTMEGYSPLPEHRLIENSSKVPMFRPGLKISLGIGLDEPYRGKGLSTFMVKKLLEHIGDQIDPTQLLVIDVDASEGYWVHIGMVPNRGERRVSRGDNFGDITGYEKTITYRDLNTYMDQIADIVMPRLRPRKGGTRKKKQKKTRRYGIKKHSYK